MVSATLQPGTRVPAYCTANGRVLLAALPQADVRLFEEAGHFLPGWAEAVSAFLAKENS